MSSSYERVNYITSFGFSQIWRRQYIEAIEIQKESTVLDLMTGMGECWRPILKQLNLKGKLIALDFSSGMLKMAKKRTLKYPDYNIELLQENVFENSIKDNSINHVFCGFGLKTLSIEQVADFASEINRMLKTNGSFSFIEVSVPNNPFLKWPYLFYLKYMIPILGFLFLGNPQTYKMLGVYTSRFKNSKSVEEIFKQEGFNVEYLSYFYGCATGIKGIKK